MTERTTRRATPPPHRLTTRPSGALRRRTGRLAGTAAALAVLVGLGPMSGPAAHAADNPYERGPAPTTSSIDVSRGPYAVSQTSVSSLSVTGFGGGTIYYPTSTSDGTFGAVAVGQPDSRGRQLLAALDHLTERSSVRGRVDAFYASLSSSLDRGYLELNSATHFTPSSSNTTIAKYSISWLKRLSTTTPATSSPSARFPGRA